MLSLDVRAGLPQVDAMWAALLDEAETVEPSHYGHSNGWVVAALLGAWSAISRTSGFETGVVEAVRGGGDTDTVAAIAGALLGARYGGSTVPFAYRRMLHGWPGLRGRDLAELALRASRGGGAETDGWTGNASYGPSSTHVVPHPDDPGVLLGALGSLRSGVAEAVVSLCRVEPLSWLAPADHVEVHLVDRDDANNDLRFTITDAALAVQALRADGKTVLLHCVHAQTRTPVVAAAYGSLVTGTSEVEALGRV